MNRKTRPEAGETTWSWWMYLTKSCEMMRRPGNSTFLRQGKSVLCYILWTTRVNPIKAQFFISRSIIHIIDIKAGELSFRHCRLMRVLHRHPYECLWQPNIECWLRDALRSERDSGSIDPRSWHWSLGVCSKAFLSLSAI